MQIERIPMIRDGFSVTEEDVEGFRRAGYRVLRGLFTPEIVEHMRSLGVAEVVPPPDNYGSGFSRLKYDVGNDDPVVLALMGEPAFVDAMVALTGSDLFFTQGLGFELETGTSTGFGWHVGTQSFGFQRREDRGYTIWTPLCGIDTEGQRGGMAYVPKDVLSGEFVYQHITLLPDYVRARLDRGEQMGFADFSRLKNGLLNSPEMSGLLDHHAEEDDFEPGDVLLFDKYVLHRSVPLLDGPVASRLAYAMRFSSITARYDEERVDALAYPRRLFDYDVGSPFNDDVASRNDEQVYLSPYFDGTREERTIGSRHVLHTR